MRKLTKCINEMQRLPNYKLVIAFLASLISSVCFCREGGSHGEENEDIRKINYKELFPNICETCTYIMCQVLNSWTMIRKIWSTSYKFFQHASDFSCCKHHSRAISYSIVLGWEQCDVDTAFLYKRKQEETLKEKIYMIKYGKLLWRDPLNRVNGEPHCCCWVHSTHAQQTLKWSHVIQKQKKTQKDYHLFTLLKPDFGNAQMPNKSGCFVRPF